MTETNRTLTPPPAPETRPFMIAACLAAAVMTFLALEPRHPARPVRGAASATPSPGGVPLAPASTSPLDATALILRLDALRRCRTRAEERMSTLRAAMEEDRGPAQVADLRIALLESDEDVRLTRELVRELDEAAPSATPVDSLATTTTRALALQWLALSRQCWLRQKLHVLTRPPGEAEDWTLLAETGPEAASGAMIPALRRWLAAAETQLRRPATMPSTAGPELAELLEEVHAVSTATYVLNWHTTAQPLVDQAAKTFLAGVSRLQGLTAPLISKIAADLWRWGHAEGAMMAYASGVMFDADRESTMRRMGELASFLAPPARDAMQRLISRARAGFRPDGRRPRTAPR